MEISVAFLHDDHCTRVFVGWWLKVNLGCISFLKTWGPKKLTLLWTVGSNTELTTWQLVMQPSSA
jgi:hypothetical protein